MRNSICLHEVSGVDISLHRLSISHSVYTDLQFVYRESACVDTDLSLFYNKLAAVYLVLYMFTLSWHPFTLSQHFFSLSWHLFTGVSTCLHLVNICFLSYSHWHITFFIRIGHLLAYVYTDCAHAYTKSACFYKGLTLL